MYELNFTNDLNITKKSSKSYKGSKSANIKKKNKQKLEKKRDQKSYHKMIDTILSMEDFESLEKINSWKDIPSASTDSFSSKSDKDQITPYSGISEIFNGDELSSSLHDEISEYLAKNKRKKSKSAGEVLSVDLAVSQVKTCLKKLHKFCQLNLLEVRKDFSTDSMFLQILMMLVNKLGVIEVYKQRDASGTLFEEDTTEYWHYCVRLKDTRPVSFDKD